MDGIWVVMPCDWVSVIEYSKRCPTYSCVPQIRQLKSWLFEPAFGIAVLEICDLCHVSCCYCVWCSYVLRNHAHCSWMFSMAVALYGLALVTNWVEWSLCLGFLTTYLLISWLLSTTKIWPSATRQQSYVMVLLGLSKFLVKCSLRPSFLIITRRILWCPQELIVARPYQLLSMFSLMIWTKTSSH